MYTKFTQTGKSSFISNALVIAKIKVIAVQTYYIYNLFIMSYQHNMKTQVTVLFCHSFLVEWFLTDVTHSKIVIKKGCDSVRTQRKKKGGC